jgi:UDP-glucose 4-epimerase
MSTTEKTILVAGGCGYIGTHTIVVLLQQGYSVVVVDNLSNSNAISLDKVSEIVGLSAEERSKRLVFYGVNICNEAELRKVFEASPTFTSCIHFAGLKVSFHRGCMGCFVARAVNDSACSSSFIPTVI